MTKKKVLLAHNYYKKAGGEDIVFEAEKELLLQMGHEVLSFTRDNKIVANTSFINTSFQTIWSHKSSIAIKKLIDKADPDVAHFHNTFLLISPSAYFACHEKNIPVVQTLHNYRLLCPNALFLRNNQICEDCLGLTPPLYGILYGCWRNSRSQTSLVVTMLTIHRWLKTWQKKVDIYIALTEFARQKFILGGLPADKIMVKPNFVYPDPEERTPTSGDYALFVGRLSPEKGISVLLKAWLTLENIPLRMVGDGPLMYQAKAAQTESIDIFGQRSHDEVITLMKNARFLIFPSKWYEGFPMIIVEAFACGVPIIASRLGAMEEIIEDGCTGLLFNPGDAEDLSAKVRWAWDHLEAMEEMGHNARLDYEEKYTAEKNYEQLMHIYNMAISSR